MIDFAIGFGVGFAGAAIAFVLFGALVLAIWAIAWRSGRDHTLIIPPRPPV